MDISSRHGGSSKAGTRCVTLAFSRWDHHGKNFDALRQDLPLLDQGVSALVEDIHQRGLDKDVSVIVWGEFGRTPTINKDGGRDHWPRVSCAMLFGGGMKVGQVIGATDRLGGEAVERPVHFGEYLRRCTTTWASMRTRSRSTIFPAGHNISSITTISRFAN